MFWRVIVFSFVFALIFGVFGFQEPTFIGNNDALSRQIKKREWIDSVSNTLTLDEKIAQFFMAAAYTNKDAEHIAEVENLVMKTKVGGLIFFKGHPTVQAHWINDLQQKAKLPLMLSIDGEWGINMRLDSTIQYPKQLTLGAIQDNRLIYDMGKRIANECKAVGLNINLAPVVDVNNNMKNPVINDRSFGEDPNNVALKGLAYMQGMQDEHVMAVGKHFPGHGDTDTDSHLSLPTIPHSRARLDSVELVPFKLLFDNGLMGVMAAHLHIPSLDNRKNRAVSLSKNVTTYLLRDTLGFDGLVFSDALNMKGVSDYFSPGEVDLEAFLAGNDILLFSEDITRGIALIKKAVKSGKISEEYINTRLIKVLAYKYDLGLDKKPALLSTNTLTQYLTNPQGTQLQKKLYEKAITLVRHDEKIIPLSPKLKIGVFSIHKKDNNLLTNQLEGFTKINSFSVSNYNLEKIAAHDIIIAPVYAMSKYASKNYGFTDAELLMLKEINKKTKVIIVLFGSPYSLKHFQDFENIIVAYEENHITEQAVANMLLGNLSIEGRLPVSAGKYKAGSGITILSSIGLENVAPNSIGINTYALAKIDSIINDAIKNEATPGAQILIAKEGKVFYNKAFGFFDYEKNEEVNLRSIYDVASITKIVATTLAVMKLYEENKLDLKQTIGYYLPEFDDTNICGVTIESILLHHSGLPGWIPFYTRTVSDSIYGNWYQSEPNQSFCIPVADNMYMCADSTGVIWNIIGNQNPKEQPNYRYSDIGFYILKQVIERITEKPLDKYVAEQFYAPLELFYTGFLPLNRFDKKQIVPTENDAYFRNQKIQGYVHDMGAAMLGGVSGHAGVFSTSNDLAVILQMLLNKGVYNNIQFFKPETIAYFTSKKIESNRRGLGFDKPTEYKNGSGSGSDFSSSDSYGHTGFTGCIFWADPKYDLVYVFLSNRTYPTMNNDKLVKDNVRTKIHDLAYEAIGINTIE